MKYRVNLFPNEIKPKLDLVTLNFVVVVWVLAIGGVGLLSQYYQSVYVDTEHRTQTTQQEYKNQKTLLDTLTEARDNRAQDSKLVELVKTMQGEERDKYLLLTELQGRERLKNQGFSLLMKDLAKQHISEIWLTRININERKIRIEGGSLESSKVPVWVSKLRYSEYFTGRNFAGARMFRNDFDELNFVISSDLTELALQAELDPASGLTQ